MGHTVLRLTLPQGGADRFIKYDPCKKTKKANIKKLLHVDPIMVSFILVINLLSYLWQIQRYEFKLKMVILGILTNLQIWFHI